MDTHHTHNLLIYRTISRYERETEEEREKKKNYLESCHLGNMVKQVTIHMLHFKSTLKTNCHFNGNRIHFGFISLLFNLSTPSTTTIADKVLMKRQKTTKKFPRQNTRKSTKWLMANYEIMKNCACKSLLFFFFTLVSSQIVSYGLCVCVWVRCH